MRGCQRHSLEQSWKQRVVEPRGDLRRRRRGQAGLKQPRSGAHGRLCPADVIRRQHSKQVRAQGPGQSRAERGPEPVRERIRRHVHHFGLESHRDHCPQVPVRLRWQGLVGRLRPRLAPSRWHQLVDHRVGDLVHGLVHHRVHDLLHHRDGPRPGVGLQLDERHTSPAVRVGRGPWQTRAVGSGSGSDRLRRRAGRRLQERLVGSARCPLCDDDRRLVGPRLSVASAVDCPGVRRLYALALALRCRALAWLPRWRPLSRGAGQRCGQHRERNPSHCRSIAGARGARRSSLEQAATKGLRRRRCCASSASSSATAAKATSIRWPARLNGFRQRQHQHEPQGGRPSLGTGARAHVVVSLVHGSDPAQQLRDGRRRVCPASGQQERSPTMSRRGAACHSATPLARP
mmetsp:Transcript_21556/g.82031  ORF Transcript_21556/g.82031 Transcript_21556/m.82031 type:complete len:403 (+) Transcript_21556:705-1913(+)